MGVAVLGPQPRLRRGLSFPDPQQLGLDPCLRSWTLRRSSTTAGVGDGPRLAAHELLSQRVHHGAGRQTTTAPCSRRGVRAASEDEDAVGSSVLTLRALGRDANSVITYQLTGGNTT